MARKFTRALARGYAKKLREERSGFTQPHLVTGEDPTESSIMVSRAGHEKRVPIGEVTGRSVVQYARNKKTELVQPKQYMGAYPMEEEPTVAFDVSIGVPFKGPNKDPLPYAEAMRLAAVHNQESVYDPRKRASSMFPKNPHYKKGAPKEAANRAEWESSWMSSRLTGEGLSAEERKNLGVD